MSLLKIIVTKLHYSLLLAGIFIIFSAQAPTREYQIKAVFLYNFTQFVDWPQKAFPEKGSPLIIGVLGENPFGDYLDKTVYNEQMDGHPLHVKKFNDVSKVKDCHILFISDDKRDQLATVLAQLKSKNVLIVGDGKSFLEEGGMIRFFLDKGKVRMQVNLEEVKKADLKISSKLLRVAEIVTVKK